MSFKRAYLLVAAVLGVVFGSTLFISSLGFIIIVLSYEIAGLIFFRTLFFLILATVMIIASALLLKYRTKSGLVIILMVSVVLYLLFSSFASIFQMFDLLRFSEFNLFRHTIVNMSLIIFTNILTITVIIVFCIIGLVQKDTVPPPQQEFQLAALYNQLQRVSLQPAASGSKFLCSAATAIYAPARPIRNKESISFVQDRRNT